ncbi:MAG: hypothetical protein IJ325_03290 [Clostridia bacterium]|nr:hypothetical protein [Clostridia bacterium]
MKKTVCKLFILLFFAVCVFFSLGLVLPGASDPESDNPPELLTENGINDDFGSEFEEWFSKHFAFHHAVTDFFADARLALFSEGNDQVIAGRDDFLFFDDTTADYIGTNRMTDADITKTAEALATLNEQVEAAGGKFLFVCAPNKNTIYGEYLPSRYIKSTSPTDLDRLYAELDVLDVPYVDLRPLLTEAKENTLVYHKRDTHWNGAGAEIAMGGIAEHFSIPMPDYGVPITVSDFEGDLDALLFPGKTMYDENITYNFEGLFVYTSAYATPMDLVITARSGGTGKLLMFRDSFANAMIPYAASTFGEIRMERVTPYQTAQLETYKPDYVIVEIAERNLREIAGYITPAE